MKVAVLFSGGKDSNYALYLASKQHEISCLITLIPENEESYMFQTVGNNITQYQAKALEIPHIIQTTKGEKEKELEDLKSAIKTAKEKYKIEGVVTGAINSAYQSSRVQRICNDLELWCFNPLWQINEEKFLNELIENKFETIIVGIGAYPLTQRNLGMKIDKEFIEKISNLSSPISLVGEGGEFESLVLNGPLYKKKLEIIKSEIKMDSENSGTLEIKGVELKW